MNPLQARLFSLFSGFSFFTKIPAS
jgi:hypothetical protein